MQSDGQTGRDVVADMSTNEVVDFHDGTTVIVCDGNITRLHVYDKFGAKHTYKVKQPAPCGKGDDISIVRENGAFKDIKVNGVSLEIEDNG